jgi:tetratricopeptide (TPR) repeat protein
MLSVTPLFLAVLFLLHSVLAQEPAAQDHARVGLSLAREGKLPEAEQQLRAAVRLAPVVAPYRAQLGSILGLQGKWKEALESFQKAVDLDANDLNFRRETAAVQWQLGLMAPAEKNLQFVLTKHPGDSGATLLLGLVKEKTGEYASAVELLDSQFELVASQPDRTAALFHSIVESGQHDKIPKIVEALRAHVSDSQWANAIDRCIQIAATAGDPDTAKVLFALIPDNDPGRPRAGVQLAKIFYSRGQVSQAKELVLRLAEQSAANPDLQALLGNCFESEHQPALALQAYQRAIEASPTRVDYYQDPISLLLDLGKTSDALALVNRVLTLAPADARPWLWKGNAELRTHRYKDAIASYTRAAELDSSSIDPVLGVAAVRFVAGQRDAAIAEYKAGILRFPNAARLYVAYAETLLGSPDSPKLQNEAATLLEKAVKLAPELGETHYLMGQLALRQSRLMDAEAELLRSLQSDPDQSKAHFALSTVYRRMGRTDDATKQFLIYQDLKQVEERKTTQAMTTEKP